MHYSSAIAEDVIVELLSCLLTCRDITAEICSEVHVWSDSHTVHDDSSSGVAGDPDLTQSLKLHLFAAPHIDRSD